MGSGRFFFPSPVLFGDFIDCQDVAGKMSMDREQSDFGVNRGMQIISNYSLKTPLETIGQLLLRKTEFFSLIERRVI